MMAFLWLVLARTSWRGHSFWEGVNLDETLVPNGLNSGTRLTCPDLSKRWLVPFDKLGASPSTSSVHVLPAGLRETRLAGPRRAERTSRTGRSGSMTPNGIRGQGTVWLPS
jgi:hypothetical protein